MKTVFTSNEIAHVWAHKSAPYGKSPGAMSFQGDSFYSYGTVIARHIGHKSIAAIVLNDYSFSNTTSRHQHEVRMALPGHLPVFHISEGMGARLNVTGRELFDYAVEKSAEYQKQASKARQRKAHLENIAAGWLERAKKINAFFGLRRKVDEKTIERLRTASEKAEREAEVKRKAAEQKRRIEQTAQYEAWKQGTASGYGFTASLFPVTFRIESREESEGKHSYELVSTLGARVPLADAKRALRFVLSHREGGWARNGETHHVGCYQLDSISSAGVKAGCHQITWAEIDRLVSVLNS